MIYISSACINAQKIRDSVRVISTMGVHNIELSGGTKYYENYVEDLIEIQKQKKLCYSWHGYFPPPPKDLVINLASCNDVIYKKSISFYVESIPLMKKLKCKTLSVHSGFYMDISPAEIGKKISVSKIYNQEMANQRFCDAVEQLQKAAKSSGINVMVENNVLSLENYKNFDFRNLFMMTDYESIKKIRQQLDFDFLLDVGHLKVSSHTLGRILEQELEKLLPIATWLHIHDNDGKTDMHGMFCRKSEIYGLLEKNRNKLPENITIEVHGTESAVAESYLAIQTLLNC